MELVNLTFARSVAQKLGANVKFAPLAAAKLGANVLTACFEDAHHFAGVEEILARVFD